MNIFGNRPIRIMKNLPLLLIFPVIVMAVSYAFAIGPYAKSNDSWITISGTVTEVAANNFSLNYGAEEILVEMDDGDRDADGYRLLPGDQVTVTGKIDDDLWEKTTIEAASVHVKKLGTTFFASQIDDEDLPLAMATPDMQAAISLYGPVTAVGEKEFTLDRGKRSLRVDISRMSANPLDGNGYQKIEVGDYVRVTGTIEYDLDKKRKFFAVSITELFQ